MFLEVELKLNTAVLSVILLNIDKSQEKHQ